MARKKVNNNPKNKLKKQLEKITDTVDLESLNQIIVDEHIITLDVSKKTLLNIAKWFLDGKSEFEVRQNLELSQSEWEYLLKLCPSIITIMQHSTAYADMVVGATLLQTAIGGKVTKRKVPMKKHIYEVIDGKSVVVGETFEYVEIEEVALPNPYLLKYLSENKLSEKFGKEKTDLSKQHRDIIDVMSAEDIEAIAEYEKKEKK